MIRSDSVDDNEPNDVENDGIVALLNNSLFPELKKFKLHSSWFT